MSLLISQVESWTPDSLRATRAGADRIVSKLDENLKSLQDNQTQLSHSWHGGEAAPAAAGRVLRDKVAASKVSAALGQLGQAFDTVAAQVDGARANLSGKVSAAKAVGFEVSDNGEVTARHLEGLLEKAGGPQVQQALITLQAEVEQATTDIAGALKLAEQAVQDGRSKIRSAADDVDRTSKDSADSGAPASTTVASVGSHSWPHAQAESADTGPSGGGSGSYSGSGSDSGGGYSGDGGASVMGGLGSSGGPPGAMPSGKTADWIKQAMDILKGMGYDTSKMDPRDIAAIIAHESGGNPHAINNWDSNAAAGHPSKGLMQCIDSTFNAHCAPGHNDIWNPVDNIVAGVRYSVDRYGSLDNVPGIQAMNSGGSYVGY